MRLKVYRAATVALAMAEIRDALGLDALILSTSTDETGVEITAALDLDEEPALSSRIPGVPAFGAFADPPPSAPPIWERHGLAPDLDAALQDAPAASTCARMFRFAALPLEGGGSPTMLVGPPGAGKTLSIAKLAARLVLAGHHPMVITADDQRAGAVEQLAGFTRLLGLTLIAAGGPEMLSRALGRREKGAPVLIDAPGLDLQDPRQYRIMTDLLSASGACPMLVLPAGLDRFEAIDIGVSHAAHGTRHLLATRLDRRGRLGGILSAARQADLALTEAGVGSAVAGGLEPITPDWLARRLRPERDSLDPTAFRAPVPFTAPAAYDGPRATPLPDVISAHIAAQARSGRPILRPDFRKTPP